MASKKVGKQGVIIHGQGREIINNVCNFMKIEAEEGLTIPLKNYRERTIAATGVSLFTYQKVSKEAQKIVWEGPGTSFQSPKTSRETKKWKLDRISPDRIKMIRQIVYDFYLLEKRLPTLKCLLQKINHLQILEETISISSLGRLLKEMGFRWQKMPDKRKMLCEPQDIRLKRINFLKTLNEYRSEGRNIIYTEETYIYNSHVKKNGQLIIRHAGGEKGFVENALLIFKSGTKTGDYHTDINHQDFFTWVEKQLLPNLPDRSVLVIDNAAYHNVLVENNISTASKKEDILNWLTKHDLPADPKLTKPELYYIFQENKFRFPTKYKLDEMLKQHGHCTLSLPPYHPELNPVQKIWTLVKSWVAAHNTTFKLTDTEALARQKIEEVSEDEWYNICQHVKKYEEELIKKEHLFDIFEDHLNFTVNTGSSDKSEYSNDELMCSPLVSDSE